MKAAATLGREVGKKAACEGLKVPRATLYRHLSSPAADDTETVKRPSPPLALTAQETQRVLDILHSELFQDKAPHQVYAILLDDGQYHCSIRTMYRILAAEHGDVKERRRQVQRPAYAKPELLATGPNQVWSWAQRA